MKISDPNDLNLEIARGRMVLSALALILWYIDPADGGWFFIDTSSLIVFSFHCVYSFLTFAFIRSGNMLSQLRGICTVADVVFAGVITYETEGSTSPSWLFFLFAIVAVDSRTSFRASIIVTISATLLYFVLLMAFAEAPRNEYLMRSAYLGITGYLVGFVGAQRARFATRMRFFEAAAERHEIARALHDGYVQALAGVNLRLETCRELLQTGHSGEVVKQLIDLQHGVTNEYDSVRSYVRSLVDIEHVSGKEGRPFAIETLFEMKADFVGRASTLVQVLQIILEGTRNTWRHSNASTAAINISAADNHIRIAIDDNGVGFDDCKQAPWAIASRVAENGGWLRIGREQGGAHLQIEIPE
ncbi:MAG TPA: histidine kinase [Candidatus Binataceae bacterium]|nr:histidine kinase [Candidatus Binataceae bacterium]